MKTQATHRDSDPAVLPTGRSMDSDMKPPPKIAVLKDPKGFTLVELMITMMILGIIGMAGFSFVSTLTLDRQLSRACQVLMSGIEHTRFLAKCYQRPFNLILSTAGNSFTVIVDPNPPVQPWQQSDIPLVNDDDVVQHPLSNRWYIVNFNTLPGLENTTISGPTTLTFAEAGNASLADVDYVLAAGSQTRTVRVSGISGRVTIK